MVPTYIMTPVSNFLGFDGFFDDLFLGEKRTWTEPKMDSECVGF